MQKTEIRILLNTIYQNKVKMGKTYPYVTPKAIGHSAGCPEQSSMANRFGKDLLSVIPKV